MPFRRRPGDRYDFRRPNTMRSYTETRIAEMGFTRAASRAARIAAARGPMFNRANRGLQIARGELKSVDVTGSIAADTTSAVLLLNGIARGDDIGDRIGRKVIIKMMELRFKLGATSDTGIDQVQRLLVVYDKQTNGAACTGAQVLATVASAYAPYSPTNLENRNRFVVLYDTGAVSIQSDVLGAVEVPKYGSQRVFNMKRYFSGLPVTFNAGDAGTVADISTGSIYAVVCGSVAAGATAGSAAIYSRIRYEDA